MRRLSRAAVAAVAALALTASGCSSDDPPPTPAAPGQLETTDVKVGSFAVIGASPLYIALRKGYFKAEGLNVTTELYPMPTAAVAAMLKGDTAVTFASYIPLFLAQANADAKLRIIAESSAVAPNAYGIFVMPDSPIQQTADLAGKKIGVNARGLLATVLTNETLRTAGVDTDSVTYVEVPFGEMGATLTRGDIDAAFLPEPFLTAASVNLGVIRVADVGIGPVDGLPTDGYAVTEGWAKIHPNTAAAFQRAIQRAAADASNRAEVEAVVTDYARVDQRLAPLMAPLQYPQSLNPIRLQRVADLMESQGLLEKRLDVAAFVGVPAP